jgi:hypothetical protein
MLRQVLISEHFFASFNNNDSACWREIAKAGDYGGHGIQETSRLRM